MAAGRITSARSSRSPSSSTRWRYDSRDSVPITAASASTPTTLAPSGPGAAPAKRASASMLPPVAANPAGARCRAAEGMRSVDTYSSSRRRNRPGSWPAPASSSSSRTDPMVCDSLQMIPRPVDQRDLDAAPAEIDEEPRLRGDRDPALDRQVDQPGLLGAGDDLEVDAGLVAHPLDEALAVRALANSARRDGPVAGDPEDVHPLPEAGERRHRAVHGVARQLAGEEDVVPESDRRPLTLQHGPGRRVGELGGVESDRVRADVDGTDPERERHLTRGCRAALPPLACVSAHLRHPFGPLRPPPRTLRPGAALRPLPILPERSLRGAHSRASAAPRQARHGTRLA